MTEMPKEIYASEQTYNKWGTTQTIPRSTKYIRADIHDLRVTELLEANNRLLERARIAESCECKIYERETKLLRAKILGDYICEYSRSTPRYDDITGLEPCGECRSCQNLAVAQKLFADYQEQRGIAPSDALPTEPYEAAERVD